MGTPPVRPIERRKYERYRVDGKASFWMTTEPAVGEVLDVGSGGLLVRSDVLVPQGARVTMQFKVAGSDRGFIANGRVIRTQMDVLAIMFLEKVEGLEDLLKELKEKQAKVSTAGPAATGT